MRKLIFHPLWVLAFASISFAADTKNYPEPISNFKQLRLRTDNSIQVDRLPNNTMTHDYTVRAEGSKQRQVFLGDSNTWTTNTNNDLDTRDYYHHLIQDWFRPASTYTINQGDGGDTISDMLDRFALSVGDRYVQDATNILHIMSGYNDAAAAVSGADFWDDYKTVVINAYARS